MENGSGSYSDGLDTTTSAPLHRNEVLRAIISIEENLNRRRVSLRVMEVIFWVFFVLMCISYFSTLMIYQAAMSARGLANILPFSSNLVPLFTVFVCLLSALWFYTRYLNQHSNTYGRIELAHELERANIAEDLVDRRLDFTGLLQRDVLASRLLVFGRKRQHAPTTTYKLNQLAMHLDSFLGRRPANLLLSRDYCLILTLVALVASWMVLDYFVEDNLWMIFLFVIMCGPELIWLPSEYRDMVAYDELSSYLRKKLGFAPRFN